MKLNFMWVSVYISSIAILFPVIAGITRINYLSSPMRTILAAVMNSLVLEILSWAMLFITYTNHWVFNICNIIEFGILGYFYFQMSENEKYKKCLAAIIIIFLIVFPVYLYLHPGSIYRLNPFVNATICLLLTFLSLAYFYQLLQNPKTDNISKYPYFWVNVGVLVCFSGNFFLALLRKFVDEDKSANYLAVIYFFVLLVIRLCFGLAFRYSKTLNKPQKITELS